MARGGFSDQNRLPESISGACFAAEEIMTLRRLALGALTSLLWVGSGAAQSPNDYGDAASWLCRPGRQDACAVDLTTTVIAADGRMTRETWAADPNAPIDCFYVYPTVSTDQTPTSDMIADPAERSVVRTQFARFATVCRPYAPLYRQVTLVGLRAAMAGSTANVSMTRGVGYNDVRDAWNYYLQHDNQGRGVVLIGHSQGSFVLMELIRNEIDGKPVQSKLLAAILAGTTLPVPKGQDVGGAFQHVPVCRSNTQTGCVIAYASYRATSPPPADALFGRVANPAMQAACANAAALGGGSAELHSYFATGTRRWVDGDVRIETPFVSLPGLITAQCASKDGASYLEITVHGDPADPRADDIGGDMTPAWGLHQIDVSLEMGNLVDVVRRLGQKKTSGADRLRVSLPQKTGF
jgi:pimeloyl-ACP methyl ester carboxylesterase